MNTCYLLMDSYYKPVIIFPTESLAIAGKQALVDAGEPIAYVQEVPIAPNFVLPTNEFIYVATDDRDFYGFLSEDAAHEYNEYYVGGNVYAINMENFCLNPTVGEEENYVDK